MWLDDKANPGQKLDIGYVGEVVGVNTAPLLECIAHGIAFRQAHGEKVVAMGIRLERHRRSHRCTGETLYVLGRDRTPASDVLVYRAQLETQQRRLRNHGASSCRSR